MVAIALGIDFGGAPIPKTPNELGYLGGSENVSKFTTRLSRFNVEFNKWLKASFGSSISKVRIFRVFGRILNAIRPVTNIVGGFAAGYVIGLIPGCAIAAVNKN